MSTSTLIEEESAAVLRGTGGAAFLPGAKTPDGHLAENGVALVAAKFLLGSEAQRDTRRLKRTSGSLVALLLGIFEAGMWLCAVLVVHTLLQRAFANALDTLLERDVLAKSAVESCGPIASARAHVETVVDGQPWVFNWFGRFWVSTGFAQLEVMLCQCRKMGHALFMSGVLGTMLPSLFVVHMTLVFLARFLGVHPIVVLRMAKAHISARTAFVVMGNLVGLFLFAHWSDITLRNFSDTRDGAFSTYRMYEIMFFAPLREEVLFRLVLVLILNNRMPRRPVLLVLLSTLLFSVSHIGNLFTGRHSTVYVLLQVVLGLLIGGIYAREMVSSRRIFGSVIMHVMNNAISSVNVDSDATGADLLGTPRAQMSLAYTLIMYTCALFMQ